jgi:hypothetical protein
MNKSNMKKILRESIARTLWVTAWADYTEENEPAKTKGWAGQDLLKIAPKTPQCGYEAARLFLEKMGQEGLSDLLTFCAEEDLEEEQITSLGHYLVMEGLGSGVTWEDDPNNKPHPLKDSPVHTQTQLYRSSRKWVMDLMMMR